jgi:hypothetical protein
MTAKAPKQEPGYYHKPQGLQIVYGFEAKNIGNDRVPDEVKGQDQEEQPN